MARAPFRACLLVTAVLLAGQTSAQDREKAVAKVEVAMELRHTQLQALRWELDTLADPALTAAQAIMLIADWGRQAKDAQSAVTALETIAEAAKGTPVGRLALVEVAKLLAGKKRHAEGVRALTRLAVEAVKQGGPSAADVGHADEPRLKEWDAQLRAKEAALTAQSRQLEEEAQRLKEYALALKAEEAKLEAGQSNPAPGDTGAAPAVGGHPSPHPDKPAGEAN